MIDEGAGLFVLPGARRGLVQLVEDFGGVFAEGGDRAAGVEDLTIESDRCGDGADRAVR